MAAANPIRIVPLRTQAIAPRAAPELTYRGGPLIASVQVFLFFWGNARQQDPHVALVHQMNDFFESVVTSSLIDQLSEYSVPGFNISHGSRTGAIALTTPPPPNVADADIHALIQQEVSSDPAVTHPTPNSLYFVFSRGWYDHQNGEIGDICAWQTRREGPYTVQLEWSNKEGRCV